MSFDWFRSWHGAPQDIKWLSVSRSAGVPTSLVLAVAWSLLDRASQVFDRGSIEGYDAHALAAFLECEPQQVEVIVEAMVARRIIVRLRFANWEKRQPIREDGSAERAKAWREAKRSVIESAQTHPNASKRRSTRSSAYERQERDVDQDPSLRSGKGRPPSKESSSQFEDFWIAYPNKVGKAAAKKAFDSALQRVELPTLMRGLQSYANKIDDRPWCNPSTWLNQDRWADQPATFMARGSLSRGPTIGNIADRLLAEMSDASD